MTKESYLLAQTRDWILEKKGEMGREGSVQCDETRVNENGEYSVTKGKVTVTKVEITVEIDVRPALKNNSNREALWKCEREWKKSLCVVTVSVREFVVWSTHGRNAGVQLWRQGGYHILIYRMNSSQAI